MNPFLRLDLNFIVKFFIVPPGVTINPPRQTVDVGDNPLITCTVISGDQPVEIKWRKVQLLHISIF